MADVFLFSPTYDIPYTTYGISMIIDGKTIRDEIKDALAVKVGGIPPEDRPTLFIVMAGANTVTKNFVAIKKRFAEALGIPVEERIFDETESPATAVLVNAVKD